jgi:hypothetical protein
MKSMSLTNVIIISIICYNYLLAYIVSSTYRDHFRIYIIPDLDATRDLPLIYSSSLCFCANDCFVYTSALLLLSLASFYYENSMIVL